MTKTISKLACDVGLKPDTIRYYERIGLLPQPPRTPGNYRTYDASTAERLRFIKGGQRLGLKLEEIRELLDIKDTGLCPCGHTAGLLRKRITALDEELQRLSALRQELASMVEGYSEDQQSTEAGRWHCSGQLIAPPGKFSDWLCSGGPDCSPSTDGGPSTEGGENG